MSERIHSMFNALAGRYDRANDVVSLGMHQRIRRKMFTLLNLEPGMDVLDIATGTGDLALTAKENVGKDGRVVGLDFAAEMLEVAQRKSADAGLEVEWVEGDAMALPFKDSSFDAVTVGFGLRNVDDPANAIGEMHRVLRPGGVCGIIESGLPKRGLKRVLLSVSTGMLMPLLGGLATGRPRDYAYLSRSTANFPGGTDFIRLLTESAPFENVRHESHGFGIVHIYIAEAMKS